MKAAHKETLLLFAVGVAILATLWSAGRRPPAAPVSPEVAFSPQMRTLVNDILEKEHVRHLPPHLWDPTPYSMMDVDESALLSRKDDIARAASSSGDRVLVELLMSLNKAKWEKDGGETKDGANADAPKVRELLKIDYRKSIERLLEQNGLGPVILLPDR